MKIYRPVKGNFLNQDFGANNVCSPDGQLSPVTNTINGRCSTGTSLLYPKLGLKGHNGQDWALYRGAPIYHSGDFVGWMKTEIDQNGGIGVRVISNAPLVEGKHAQLVYWHLQKIEGYDKKEVWPGDLIGYGDSTGLSSGDHLHFGLKTCTKEGVTLNKDNGYFGCLDIRRYFTNMFILDHLSVTGKLTTLQKIRELLFTLQLLVKKKT